MGVLWPIIKNENVKFYKGIYNSQIKKVEKSYQENQGWCLSYSVRAVVIYRLHDYIQFVHIGSKFQLDLSNPWWNFSLVWHDEILYVIVILSLHCFYLSYKKKSHYDLTSWNFSQGVPPTLFSHLPPPCLRFFHRKII